MEYNAESKISRNKRYAIMYARFKASVREICVMDFKRGGQLSFTLSEVDELDDELRELIEANKKMIQDGAYDYKPPSNMKGGN